MKKLRISRRLCVIVLAAGILVVSLHYVAAPVLTFGLDSPLLGNVTLLRFAVAGEFKRDQRRVRALFQRLSLVIPGSRADLVEMHNESFGEMRVPISRESLHLLAAEPQRPENIPDDIIAGLASERSLEPSALSSERPEDTKPIGVPAAWTHVAGTDEATRFSLLHQITPGNVADLQLAHVVDSLEHSNGSWTGPVQTSPLTWGSLIFWMSADEWLNAFDVRTGTTRWAFKLPAFGRARRGLALGVHGETATLFAPMDNFLLALDAETGQLTSALGGQGVATLDGFTVIAPVLWKDQILLALYDSQAIVGLDVATGRETMRVALHPEDRSFEGGAPWSGMALDRDRDVLFVTTGNPRPALIGITRPGPNANSNSIIAIDLKRRAIEWAFQEVRHDLWDYDIASGPMLSSVMVNGRRVDIVVAVSKMGNTLMLERESGRPIFDFRLASVPRSRHSRDETAPRQPHLDRPEPLFDIAFDPSKITDVSPESHAFVERQLSAGTSFGRFRPPQLNKDVVVFGVHGGAEWHGAAIDTQRGRLYVPVNVIPWMLRVYLHATPGYVRPSLAGHAGAGVYASKCASCHMPSGNGRFVTAGEAAREHVPSLHGYSLAPDNAHLFTSEAFSRHHDIAVTDAELTAVWEAHQAWDADLFQNGQATLLYHWRQLVDQDRLPGSQPPWGKVVAMDLGMGEKSWEVPLGQKMVNGRIVETGSPSYGGLIATQGGVAFVVGTDDNMIRAIALDTGETRWRYTMSAAGSAPPITFEVDGRQYVAAVATGGRFHNFLHRASKLYVFALPDGPSSAPTVGGR